MVWQKVFGGPRAGTDTIGVADAKRKLDAKEALLVDVREANEWAAGHAAGARHIPLGQLTATMPDLPRDSEIMLVCQSGARSGLATKILRQGGFDKAINVEGGMTAWQRQGLPIVRGS